MARIVHLIKPVYGFPWDIINSIGLANIKSVVLDIYSFQTVVW